MILLSGCLPRLCYLSDFLLRICIIMYCVCAPNLVIIGWLSHWEHTGGIDIAVRYPEYNGVTKLN